MGKFAQSAASKLIQRMTGEEVAPDESKVEPAAPGPIPPKRKKPSVPAEEVPGPENEPHMDEGPENEDVPPPPDDGESPDSPNGPEDEPDEAPAKKPRNIKKILMFGSIALAAVILISAVGGLLGGSTPAIDLTKAVQLSLTEKVSGYGKLEGAIDETVLTQQIAQSGAMLPKDMTADQAAKIVMDGTYITMEPSENLSNGDQVQISIVVDQTVRDQLPGLAVDSATMEWTADGLVEGKWFDPFAQTSIDLRIEGVSGTANAYLNVLASGAYVYYLNYDWSPKSGIKNGDTVTITINPAESKLSELGYAIPEKRTMEYPVGGLDEMVADYTAIPDTYLNSMVSHAEGKLADAYASVPYVEGQDIIVTYPEITSVYFLDKADKSTPYSDWFTGLQMSNAVAVLGHFYIQDVEPVTTETPGEDGKPIVTTSNEVVGTYGGYYVWLFPDLVTKAGGDFGYNSAMITQRTTSYQTEEDCLAWMKNEFSGFAVNKIGTNPAA